VYCANSVRVCKRYVISTWASWANSISCQKLFVCVSVC